MSYGKKYGPATWPPNSTGSTDEYETDEYDPSSSSDDDESDNGVGVGVATSANRRGGVARSGGRRGANKTTTNNSTSRNNARSGSGKKGGSSTSKRISGKKGGGTSTSNNGGSDEDGVDLLGSSEEEDTTSPRRRSNRKSSRSRRAASYANMGGSSDDESDNDDIGNRKRSSPRRALGRIHDNKSNTAKAAATARGNTRNSNNDSDESASGGDSDSSDDSGRIGMSNKRRKVVPNKKKSSSMMDDSSDDDDDDDSDSDDSFDLGRNRNAALAKRRNKFMNKGYSNTGGDSSSSEEDDGDEKDDSDSDSDGGLRNKKKKPVAKMATSAKASAKSGAGAAKKTSLYDSDSDSSLSIECLGVSPRKNPSRKARSPQKKPAAATAGRLSPAAKKLSLNLLSSDDDDLMLPAAAPTSAAARRRSPRKSASTLSSTSASSRRTSPRKSSRKSPPEAGATAAKAIHHDPSVRVDSLNALEQARKAREVLKAAQSYHAKEVELPDVELDLPSHRPPAAAAARGAAGAMDIVDIDSDGNAEFAAAPSAARAASSVAPTITYSGLTIRVTLRYQNPLQSNKNSRTTIRIKMDQPVQHLVDEFKTKVTGLEVTTLKFDGDNMNLSKTPSFYDMEDEDLVDAVVKQSGRLMSRVAGAVGGLFGTTKPAADAMTILHVRQKGSTSQHTFKLKRMDPLSKLVNAYCQQHSLSSVTLEYNGRVLDSSKSPDAEGLPSVADLDAVVPTSASSGAGGGGSAISLKFRINGSSKPSDTVTISITTKSRFQVAMEKFASKKGLTVSQCKFIFDGETLNQMGTPEGECLEGDEIIDVTVAAAATARVTTIAQPAASRGAARATTAGSRTSALAPAAKISVQTNRNLNKNPRQKTWKVQNTDAISELKVEYMKYYKSKKCKSVKFYFNNILIEDETKSFRELGVGGGDMIYAMENGKAYVPV